MMFALAAGVTVSLVGVDIAVSTLFVTTFSTETLNGTIWGVTLFPLLPVPKVTPQIVPFSKKKLTFITRKK